MHQDWLIVAAYALLAALNAGLFWVTRLERERAAISFASAKVDLQNAKDLQEVTRVELECVRRHVALIEAARGESKIERTH